MKWNRHPAVARGLFTALVLLAGASMVFGWIWRAEANGTAAAVIGAVCGVLAGYVWEHQDEGVAVDWWAILAIAAAAVGYLQWPALTFASAVALVVLGIGSGLVLRLRIRSLDRQETNARPPATVDSSWAGRQPLADEWRAVSGILAAGALCGGAYAVFATNNEVGSSTLMAIGVLFAVITLLGQVPRVKIGDTEIDPTSYLKGAYGGIEAQTHVVEQAARFAQTPDEVVEQSKTAGEGLKRIYSDWIIDPEAGSGAFNRASERYLRQRIDDVILRPSDKGTSDEKRDWTIHMPEDSSGDRPDPSE